MFSWVGHKMGLKILLSRNSKHIVVGSLVFAVEKLHEFRSYNVQCLSSKIFKCNKWKPGKQQFIVFETMAMENSVFLNEAYLTFGLEKI